MKKLIFSLFFIFSGLILMAQPKVVAHRGFWDTDNSAQNSITSLYKACEAGCYAIEFDVHLTSDGVLVLFHDDKLNDMLIAETSYEKLREVRLKNGEILPTLEQFLVHARNCPDIRLFLELKPRTTEIVVPVLEMIETMQFRDRTEYIAFGLDVCKEIIRRDPKAKVAYLNGELSPAELKTLGFSGIDYHYSVYLNNPDWIKQAQEYGLEVNVWTVNDPELMKKMAEMGVDYITTDKPLLRPK